MNTISILYKGTRRVYRLISSYLEKGITRFLLLANNVEYGSGFESNGIPKLDVWRKGKMRVGENLRINNGSSHNIIGRQQPCYFVVRSNAKLTIGNNVGISASAIICSKQISIGNNVKIGGNTVIYDTDFHSLNIENRINTELDKAHTSTSPVFIEDNVFIGAHSTILKGVRIGENSIVGAGSVVTKNIPPNEVWGGNPAKYIKKN